MTLSFLKSFFYTYLLLTLSLGSALAQNLNQNQQVKSFADGDYAAFKFDDSKKIVAGGRAWGVKITKGSEQDGTGSPIVTELVLNRAGVVEETFKPDLPNHPAYFIGESVRVLFFDGKIFYYNWKNANAEIKYILVPNGGSVSGKHDEWKSKVENYQNAVLSEQQNARAAVALQKEAAEKAEKMANSIQNKKVKALKVKWIATPSAWGHLSKLKYGIEAELADGKVLKTSNLGGKLPWDDFDIEVEGAEFGEEELTVWVDSDKIPNDKVQITVTAKHDKSMKTAAALDVPYTNAVRLDYSGTEGGRVNIYSMPGHRGGDGKNLIVNAVSGKTQSGKSIIKVEVQDADTGEILNKLKLAPNTALSISVIGGNGSHGNQNTKGGNGGSGGNVILYQDPSVMGLNVSVTNNGGVGGKNKDRPSMSGSTGSPGRYEVRKQAVSLSW
jgi:hypothetical protein